MVNNFIQLVFNTVFGHKNSLVIGGLSYNVMKVEYEESFTDCDFITQSLCYLIINNVLQGIDFKKPLIKGLKAG